MEEGKLLVFFFFFLHFVVLFLGIHFHPSVVDLKILNLYVFFLQKFLFPLDIVSI